MATRFVTVQDVLNVLGDCNLDEASLWALLNQAAATLKQRLPDCASGKSLLITPESTMLYHGGTVDFLQGIPDKSKFTAPELFASGSKTGSADAIEKSYVYSLGMTLFHAMQNGLEDGQSALVSDDLNAALLSMVDEAAESRSSLDDIISLAHGHTGESPEDTVDHLVSSILGTANELSSSEYGDTELDDANIEAELQEALNMSSNNPQLFGSSQSLTSRNTSFRSGSRENVAPPLTLPPPIYQSPGGGSQDRLNILQSQQRAALARKHPRSSRWSSHDRLQHLHLQPQDLDALAAMATRPSSRQLPAEPHNSYSTHLYTPSRVRKPLAASQIPDSFVQRSASFTSKTSPGGLFYRTASDGLRARVAPTGGELTSTPKKEVDSQLASTKATLEGDEKQTDLLELNVETAEVHEYVTAIEKIKGGEDETEAAQVAMTETGRSDEDGADLTTAKLLPPVAITELVLDDMPALPPPPPSLPDAELPDDSMDTAPPAAADISLDSQQQPIEEEHTDQGEGLPRPLTPPPIPDCEPPMFTPFKTEGQEGNGVGMENPGIEEPEIEADSPATDATFDYSDMPSLIPGITKSNSNNESEFSVPESPPPIPPSPPPSANGSVVKEAVTITTVAEIHSEAPDIQVVPAGWTVERSLQRRATPRTALREAFEELDKIGETGLVTVIDQEEEESDKEINDVYAQVDFSKKTKKTEPPPAYLQALLSDEEQEEEEKSTLREAGAGIEITSQPKPAEPAGLSTSETMYSEMAVSKPPTKSRLSEYSEKMKGLSVQDVKESHYAEVSGPKRHSLTISPALPPPPAATGEQPAPPTKAVGRLFEVSQNWETLQDKDTSLIKLEKLFGPEFASMSGFQPKTKQTFKPLPEGRRVVTVVLLNGKSVNFCVEHESQCGELFEQAVSYQSITEKEVFALAIVKDRDEFFMDYNRKLAKYAPEGWASTTPPSSPNVRPTTFTVFFRVKFYVENVNLLRKEHTRHQYYLQLRKDILEGKMYCHEDTALQLAAHALQAEKGDFAGLARNHDYFRPEDYLPPRVLEKLAPADLQQVLPDMHKEQAGQRRELAELNFLQEAQKLPEYGMVFYRVARDKGLETGGVWLGFCVRGIRVFSLYRGIKTALHHCPWKHITNLSFANRRFIIELYNLDKPLVFYTQSYKTARYLLHLSMAYHRFQLVYTRKGTITGDSAMTTPEPKKLNVIPVNNTSSPVKGSFAVDEGVRVVKLLKEVGKGLGIHIADRERDDGFTEVTIEEVVRDGPAHIDGKLKKGDVLLAVDGRSVAGLGRREVAEVLKETGSVVKLTVQPATSISQRPKEAVDDGRMKPSPEVARVLVTEEAVVEAAPALLDQTPPPTLLLEQSPPSDDQLDIPELPEDSSEPSLSISAGASIPASPSLASTDDETLTVDVYRGEGGSFGFAVAGNSQAECSGVTIHRITPGGSADGRLLKGDKLMSVNDVATDELSYNEVLKIIKASGDMVSLSISRPVPSSSSSSSSSKLPPGRSFEVKIAKRDGALGLRIAGGKDKVHGRGRIFVKGLNDGSAAADCKQLEEGDILLKVNGVDLSCSTHKDAAELIVNSEHSVYLEVYRPHDSGWLKASNTKPKPLVREESWSEIRVSASASMPALSSLTPIMELEYGIEPEHGMEPEPKEDDEDSPPPPQLPVAGPPVEEEDSDETPPLIVSSPRPAFSPSHFLSVQSEDDTMMSVSEPSFFPADENEIRISLTEARSEPELREGMLGRDEEEPGERDAGIFAVELKKGFRGLGFKLDKSLSDQPGHGVFVLSVDSDPALGDGRIAAGDEILEVAGESIVSKSHKEALATLRQTKGLVHLLLRRPLPPPLLPDSPPPDQEEQAGGVAGGVAEDQPSPLQPSPPRTPPPLSSPPPSPASKRSSQSSTGSQDGLNELPVPPETPPPSPAAESETDLDEVDETTETEPEDLPQVPMSPVPGDGDTTSTLEDELAQERNSETEEAFPDRDVEGIPPIPVSPVPEDLDQLQSLDFEQLSPVHL